MSQKTGLPFCKMCFERLEQKTPASYIGKKCTKKATFKPILNKIQEIDNQYLKTKEMEIREKYKNEIMEECERDIREKVKMEDRILSLNSTTN